MIQLQIKNKITCISTNPIPIQEKEKKKKEKSNNVRINSLINETKLLKESCLHNLNLLNYTPIIHEPPINLDEDIIQKI